MVEHYAAYWTYKDNMRFIQEMVPHLLKKVGKPTVIPIEDRDGTIQNVDFGSTWEQLDYCAEIQKKSGIDISDYKVGDESKMREIIKATGTQIDNIDSLSLAVMTDYLYKKLVRPFIVGPAILSNYPKFMQPLARVSDDNPNMVEQFQVVVNGWEIIKAYGELVDPVDQRERFAQQQIAIAE
jgi:lysyl-tRNA synthetase class 2